MSNSNASSRRQVTIDEYVTRWADKLIQNGFNSDPEENLILGADHLYNLLKKIADKGEKEDVRVPLRILRDLITEAWRNAARAQRDRHLYLLFQMYVGVFNRLIPPIFNAAKKQQMESVALEQKIMEELRLRYYKLVTGETWKEYPELRLIALKQMRSFAQEGYKLKQELAKQLGVTLADNGDQNKFTAKRVGIGRGIAAKLSGPQTDTWENTFEDVVNTSSEKLFALIRLMLENPDAGYLDPAVLKGQDLKEQFQAAEEPVQVQSQQQQQQDIEKPEGGGKIQSLIDLDMDMSTLDETPLPNPSDNPFLELARQSQLEQQQQQPSQQVRGSFTPSTKTLQPGQQPAVGISSWEKFE
eukprot:TRINITY_DN16804_c0_g1_i1.p1 TRINITY_DN16804_c0_g1~~TRINITY_DN16804_c0_g1_i1.p1  ORF type:complete len:373 (+),score=52.27 TRINITY_DN16804_c0_g1_i1:51-1121(+)